MTKKAVCSIMLVTALLLAAVDTQAQQIPFLPELLGRLSEFNRLYADRQKSGGDMSSIEPLRLRGEEEFKRGNLAGIIEAISQAIATLQGKKWDESQKIRRLACARDWRNCRTN